MVSAQLQIILLIVSIIVLLVIINMIRRYNLELRYSLLWLVFCFANILLAAFSNIGKTTARLLSIKEPVNAIFLLSFGFQFFLIFSLTLTISRLSNKFTQLVQEVGLLKKEVEELKNNKSSER
jgi:hypothetical protein